jgi:hypothetical protein
MGRVIKGRVLVAGQGAGEALVADQPLSFWGGYDQRTGEIIDRRHPLSGQIAAGRVLVIPGSRGSSTTSAVFLESVRLGTAPAAVVTTQVDSFLSLASIVADAMFGTPVPIVVIDPQHHATIRDGQSVRVEPDGSVFIDD